MVVFITGATKNTGLAIAQKFALNGFDVAVSSRDKANAEATAENLAKNFGINARGYALDLTDTDDIANVFARIKSDFGRLDTFVANSANLGIGCDMLSVTNAEFDDVMNINLKGTFFCCQNAANIMKEQGGGSIVLISSVHSKQCITGRCLYSVSKGGINTLACSLAIELAQYNIRANAVLAGAIRTDRWDGITQEETARRRANWPLGIESTGDDIANGVFYLGTDLSKTVTGTQITIDSGILASLLPQNNKNNKQEEQK